MDFIIFIVSLIVVTLIMRGLTMLQVWQSKRKK
jgi:hypothetical protein